MSNDALKDIQYTLLMTQEWIENLIKRYGETKIVDQLPKYFGGRIALHRALNSIECTMKQRPFIKEE